jgi:broad specificity phosphatase PhoE
VKLNLLVYGLLAVLIPAAALGELRNDGGSGGLKNAVVLVIRHAEETENDGGLSTAGEARAKAYVNYFRNFTIDGRPLQPDYMLAAADSRNSLRPRLTLEPSAKEFGLTIDTRFKNKEYLELVDEIRRQPHGANILICWHHGKIPELLRALGADPKELLSQGKWPRHVFNWLIELRYDEYGNLVESKRVDEKLLPDD